ncbi:hypothetical protein [Streptomyces sp. IBSBF 2390]|uniref:hypothetical protein n=1 Tax=Streptomyces sp. IBSBF 2390 TaxID=2903533 RepID=UPI002FDBFA91
MEATGRCFHPFSTLVSTRAPIRGPLPRTQRSCAGRSRGCCRNRPLLARAESLTLLALAAVVTAVYARPFRARHGLPLFGAPISATGRS